MITKLLPHEIFVFGSNLNGNHDGGAAKQAKDQFGAEEGIGQGLTGQCYAFPTLNFGMNRMNREFLERYRDHFYSTARALPEKEFLMTPVGTGIAGYSHEEMKSLFANPPRNVVLPPEWL